MMLSFASFFLLHVALVTGLSAFNTTGSQTLLPSVARQTKFRDHVYLAADNEATLYVNGIAKLRVEDWRRFGYANLILKQGDVVSIVASDSGVYYGIIAELYINGHYIVTGRDDWRARKAVGTSADWRFPSYPASQACRWQRTVTRPRPAEWIPGKAANFKDPTAARYVWAQGTGVGSTIHMRYVVGGQPCITGSRIYFAADNTAQLFVNGVLKASTTDWRTYRAVYVTLKKGDVVALKVKDYGVWYGAIASISSWGFSSTGREDWRAVKAFSIYGDANAWMYPSFNACRWPKAVLRPQAGVYIPGKAAGFPFSSTGARYVWASNARVNDEIFLRTVVGGQC